MPDGVQFPYAIALYVFAAPWAVLTQDHVSLLRIIVGAVHALAGALLYPIVVRTWNDRVAGAIAVVLFHLVPLPYVVIGHANLTYAFGQSTAFVTIAACVAFALQARQIHQVAVLFVLASLAFLSHVGVLPVLLTTMMAIGVLYWFIGGAPARAPGQWIVLAAACAAVFSVVTYYGQFTEVYKSLDRVRGGRVATVAPPQNGAAPEASNAPAAIPLHRRARTAAALPVRAFGWPIVVLAAAGVWRLWHGGGRDRLTLALAGAALTSCIFVALADATPVEPRFQKYSDEFIDRVNYATVPVVVILAGRAASWTWNRGVAGRAATALLLAVAAAIGLRQWIGWFN